MRTNSKINYVAIAALALVAMQAPTNKAEAYVSINVHIGAFPNLVPVPGYPVYYAPSLENNLFFYDGLYWVYLDDDWYSSSWYDGPWDWVGPFDVPEFILRVPVRYYTRPPVYFRAWAYSAPPRWGEHWGREWDDRRRGWDQWDRARMPPPAPLPFYQRDYRGDRYPHREQQHEILQRNYRYAPGQQSGFQLRNDRNEDGARDRGGVVRPAPNLSPNPGSDFDRRGDRDTNRNWNRDDSRTREVSRPPVITPDMNDRGNGRNNDRNNDLSNGSDGRRGNHQWNREASPAQPSAPRELPQPAQPREPGGGRALRPWSNNDRNEGPRNQPDGGVMGNGGGDGMRNHDRDQGRGRDRDR